MSAGTAQPAVARPFRLERAWIYRQSRMLHGYLSAFAFLALMFFSVTGLLLNHPQWFDGAQAAARESRVTLTAAELAAAARTTEPGRALAGTIAAKVALRGGYRSAETIDDEAHIRLDGPGGHSDLVVDLRSGATEVSVQRADVVSLLNDLHRGKNSGAAWAAFIDASAMVVLLLSLFGYVLFFSMKFRLATSLALTGTSLAAMAALFLIFVP